MKTISWLMLALSLYAAPADGQGTLPGGVPGVKQWYAAEKKAGGTVCWMDKLSTEHNTFEQAQQGVYFPENGINYNDALYISGASDQFNISLKDLDLSKMTVFTVYQPADTLGEKCIWLFVSDQTDNLMLTTRNVLDIPKSGRINTAAAQTAAPVLNTYLQYREKDSIQPMQQLIRFGVTDAAAGTTIRAFRGKIAEFVVYDRVLTGQEKQRVESYLALKYGISLSQAYQPASYLNSKGETIWNAATADEYKWNIAGFGRDDRSGLLQKQSCSSNTPGLLAVGVGEIQENNAENGALLPESICLLWADNRKDLEPESKTQGQPARLLRRWMATATGQLPDVYTTLQFDTKQAEQQPESSETWWLCIDRSAGGKFPHGATEYYKMDSLTPQGVGIFRQIQWDTDRSGRDLFTFGIGPRMMSKVWITQPVCSPESDGTLHIGAEGGRPPYQFILYNQEKSFQKRWENPGNSTLDITGIAPGDYTLVTLDADKTRFEEPLHIQSADAPVSGLAAQYDLKAGGEIYLDAAALNTSAKNLSYRWEGPDGLRIFSSEIRIMSPGHYRLFIDQNGCESRQDIEVNSFEPDNFANLSVSPNPVASGMPFHVIIELRRLAKTDMDIIDAAGKILSRRSFEGNNFYRLTERLNVPPGIYMLRFESEGSVKSVKLIIH